MGKRDKCYYLRQASQCRNPHSRRYGKWDCPRRFCHSCQDYKADMWPIDVWAMRRPLPPEEPVEKE